MENKVNIENIKKLLENYDYYATDELIYRTFLGLYQYECGKINVGQDIFATCLEGPPGAGKTMYAKTYTKLVKDMFGACDFVEYQCDATTSKENLYEDINITAVLGDGTNVIIPGKLVEAINKVNEGKKVILFIDEYDKAREETDAFLLQFLQSGAINTIQLGDLSIKDEYKNNLQVILCKNDFRESLSGPLARRIRIIRLDHMKPVVFNKLARKILIEDKEENDKVDEGLLNLVVLMYEEAYNNREQYLKLPSASELLLAIQDANVLAKFANAPKNIIYNIITSGMFKMEDDLKLFESSVKNNNNLKEIIEKMQVEEKVDNEEELNELIMNSYFPNKMSELEEYMEVLNEMLDEIEEIKDNPNKLSREEELKRIKLSNLEYRKVNDDINLEPNFNDGTDYIRRGRDVFSVSNKAWAKVTTITVPTTNAMVYFNKLLGDAYNKNIIAYENGFLLNEQEDYNFVMVRENKGNVCEVSIFSDSIVISSETLSKILARMLELSKVVPITDNNYKLDINALINTSKNIEMATKLEEFNNLSSLCISIDNVDDLEKYSNKLVNKIELTNIANIKEISDKLKEQELKKIRK